MHWFLCGKAQVLQDFHNLRIVCPRSQAVTSQHPQFYSVLHLVPGLKAGHLSGNFRWIKQHGEAVKTVTTDCGSLCMEAALAALDLR